MKPSIEQIHKLETYKTDSKYRFILDKALTQIKNGYDIVFSRFGEIECDDDLIIVSNCGCLISCAVTGSKLEKFKPLRYVVAKISLQILNLTYDELWSVVYGFDDNLFLMRNNLINGGCEEAFQFALGIRKILLDNDKISS